MPKKILLLGESDVGKSHFGGQLLGRLNTEKCALKMVGSPPSLAAFEEVLDALNKGRAARHTSAAHYLESRWPIADSENNQIELIWPDYGGEQVKTIRESRSMSPEWRERIVESEAWIVMVRIQHSEVSDDIFSRPLDSLVNETDRDQDFQMSPQAKLLEFLQWLMHVRGTGTLQPVSIPRLLLLLSCWDELPETQRGELPMDVISARMPMVASFLEANWRPGSLQILGLSALERPLNEGSVDEAYVDRGPETFGYVVLEDGTRTSDLTQVIAPLIRS